MLVSSLNACILVHNSLLKDTAAWIDILTFLSCLEEISNFELDKKNCIYRDKEHVNIFSTNADGFTLSVFQQM